MINRARFHFDRLYGTNQLEFGPYKLFQIGDLSCEPGNIVEEHEQIVHEISYVVSGAGTFLVNGKRYPVRRGTVFINCVGDVHEIESLADDPLRFMYIGFTIREENGSPDETIRALKQFYERPPCRLREGLFDVQEAFIAILSEFVGEDEMTDSLKTCCIHQLLCLVYRLFLPGRRQPYQLRSGSRTDSGALVYDIAHYIDEHIGSMGNLHELSDVFGYSYTYLASRFAQGMKQSLNAYTTQRKFEKACDYLTKGISVTDTAQLLGYQTIHAFSHAFKRIVGVSPSRYQSGPGPAPAPGPEGAPDAGI